MNVIGPTDNADRSDPPVERRTVLGGLGCTALTAAMPVIPATVSAVPHALTPFQVDIDKDRLDDILQRVRNFRWDVFAGPSDGGDWRYGPPPTYLRALCSYWVNGFDWRSQERLMNSVPQFITSVDGFRIHFAHERGSGPDPQPLLIMHGWPYSFHSYTQMVGRLAHPERYGGRVEDAFSVVIPSLPGYAFSGRPSSPMGPRDAANLLDKLMAETLGYSRYIAHGGD